MDTSVEFGSGAGSISISEIAIGLFALVTAAILLWLLFRGRRLLTAFPLKSGSTFSTAVRFLDSLGSQP